MVAVASRLDRSAAAARANMLARAIGYFAIVDLLFLPYFQLIILPFSLPLILLTPILVDTTIKRDRYFFLFVTLALCVFVSVAISAALPEHTIYATENLKRAIQLLSSFAYFFYFRWLGERTELDVAPIVVLFIAWFAGLGLGFFLWPSDTFNLLRSVYGRLVIDPDVLIIHLRFPYLFTDPNTAGYFFLVASSMLLLKRPSAALLITLSAVGLFAVSLTQSRGALLAFVLMIGATIYPPSEFVRSIMSARKWIVVALIAFAGFWFFYYVSEISETSRIARVAFRRFFEDRYDTGGGRFIVWSRFLGNLLPLPVGRGYVLRVENAVQGTHSDFVRVTYAYGVLALLPTLWLLFGRLVSLTPLVLPALMAFMINSLLDEQKILALYLSFLGMASVAADKKNGKLAADANVA